MKGQALCFTSVCKHAPNRYVTVDAGAVHSKEVVVIKGENIVGELETIWRGRVTSLLTRQDYYAHPSYRLEGNMTKLNDRGSWEIISTSKAGKFLGGLG
jgi:hypothetical protein